jgi:hypothetical protein
MFNDQTETIIKISAREKKITQEVRKTNTIPSNLLKSPNSLIHPQTIKIPTLEVHTLTGHSYMLKGKNKYNNMRHSS